MDNSESLSAGRPNHARISDNMREMQKSEY